MSALTPTSDNTGSWSSPGSNLVLQAHAAELVQQGLYDSAAIVGQFLVTEARRQQSTPSSDDARLDLIDSLVLLGDAFVGKGELHRAISRYEDALQISQLLRHGSTDSRSVRDDGVRLKIAQAHVLVNPTPRLCSTIDSAKHALDALEPIQHKSAACWNLMGTLYERLGRIKTASAAYQKVLDINPMAIAAAIAIIRLGGDLTTVSSLYKKSAHVWIAQLLEGHGNAVLHEHRAALAAFTQLNLRFPNTHHILVHRARTQLHLSDVDASRVTFELAHRCDPFALDYMDMYAWVLRMRAKASELGVLTQFLLSLDQFSPQPWIAVALYCDERGEREKAVKFLDKAIAMAPRHMPSYLVKGFISLAMGCAEAAVQSYKQAFQIDRRELDAYAGLVESYLALPQFNDALYIAKAAVQALPRNARALALFGTVLSRSPEGRDKAMKAFRKALSIDPKCVDAVLALSKLYIGQKQFSEAISLLEQHLAHHPSDVMHSKLAGVYAQSGNIDRALIHYHTALSLSPDSRTAIAGIERLEAALKERSATLQPEAFTSNDIDFEPVYQ